MYDAFKSTELKFWQTLLLSVNRVSASTWVTWHELRETFICCLFTVWWCAVDSIAHALECIGFLSPAELWRLVYNFDHVTWLGANKTQAHTNDLLLVSFVNWPGLACIFSDYTNRTFKRYAASMLKEYLSLPTFNTTNKLVQALNRSYLKLVEEKLC